MLTLYIQVVCKIYGLYVTYTGSVLHILAVCYAPVNINPCPPRPGTSGALAGDSQHFVSIIGESGH